MQTPRFLRGVFLAVGALVPTVLVPTALVPAVSAQTCTPCQADYDDATYFDRGSFGSLWVGIRQKANSTLAVQRIEVFTGERTGTAAVSIWTHNATNNTPGRRLARGTFAMSRTNSWQGANLSMPVPLVNGTDFWFVYEPVGGEQLPARAQNRSGQVYRGSSNQGASWNGPFQQWEWKIRHFCCTKQPGSFGTYGRSCPGTSRTSPQISSAGRPQIGTTFQLDLNAALPTTPALCMIGGSDRTWSGLTLPLALAPFGAAGCSVYCSYDVVLGNVTDSRGTANQSIMLPNNPSMLGQSFYGQWVTRDAGANTLGFTFSNGGKATIGRP